MSKTLGSSKKELYILLNNLPNLNMTNNRRHQIIRICFGTDDQRDRFEEEIYHLNSLLKLPLMISLGERLDIGSSKETVHDIYSTIGAAIKADSVKIFEQLRKDRIIGNNFTPEQGALLVYVKLINDNYPEIYNKFCISLGLGDLSEVQSAIRAYLKKTNPKYRHIKDIDRKYNEDTISDVQLKGLVSLDGNYWSEVRNRIYPLATPGVRYYQFGIQQTDDFRSFLEIVMLRTTIYADRTGLDHADYSFMAALFFQSCIEMTTTKIYLPKPLDDWIAFGIPKSSFHKHLNGLKKTFPDEAKSVDIIIKYLPFLWIIYRNANSDGRDRLTDAEQMRIKNLYDSFSSVIG